ncbi:MAG TPA: LytR C-terminal domain-containing protein [Geodermatophilus sp.]|nr:LytR C-terminal domain-containing protein [Geodermatophilus sp.]
MTAAVPHGRRRTDGPDGARRGPLPADLSEYPTTPGRSRADRRRSGLLEAGEDPGRRFPSAARPGPPPVPPRLVEPALTRPRLPVPPSASAPARPEPVRPEPVAPRTTVAPFQAVPTPADVPEPPVDDFRAAPRPAAVETADVRPALRGNRVEDRSAASAGAPVAAAPAGADLAEATPADLPGVTPAARAVVSVGGYVDWTRPSRSGAAPGEDRTGTPSTEAIPDRAPARSGEPDVEQPPATEAIPDRAPVGRVRAEQDPADLDDEDVLDDGSHDEDDEDDAAPMGPATGPSTGVVGGRAAFRAERQAAEAERRRAGRRAGGSATADDPHGDRRSGARRTAVLLLAMSVVALLVLGVYSFTSPNTQETAQTRPVESTPSAPATVAAPSTALPPLSVAPLPPVQEAPSTPVRVPVTVLNGTDVTGLAADLAAAIGANGWQSPGVGGYTGGDVAATTVFFTEGDETQRQAALQLIQQFPQISGPAPRFFEVPGTADPGLVLVAAGDWRP